MSVAARWMNLEIIILNNSGRERQVLQDIVYMQKPKNLKNNTHELINKTYRLTDKKTNLWLKQRGEG